MASDEENKKNNKVEEPRVEYEIQKPKFKGIDRETFDFDTEFAKGLTPEEAKAESIRRIGEWWGNDKTQKTRNDLKNFDFDIEFANGLTPEKFKDEMGKRIKSYPWKE